MTVREEFFVCLGVCDRRWGARWGGLSEVERRGGGPLGGFLEVVICSCFGAARGVGDLRGFCRVGVRLLGLGRDVFGFRRVVVRVGLNLERLGRVVVRIS